MTRTSTERCARRGLPRRSSLKPGLLAASSLSALLASFVGAMAQTSAPDAGEQAAQVEEVVVTAERRTQNLQDVPISATVLSANALAERAVDDLSDIQQVAPSFSVTTSSRSTLINIRGVGLALTAPTSVPGVAFYVDGVLFPHEQLIRQSFYDFGSVEVLRGPQGTLTGQNSTGGAVYVRTPAPDFARNSGYADVTVADYSRLRAVGAFNWAISDNAALRVAAVHEDMDSFTKNIGPSPSSPGALDKQESIRGNLALRTDDDRLRVNLRAEYFELKTDGNAVKRRNDLVSSDPFVIQEDAISFLDQEGYRVSAEVRYALTDGVDLRAITSYEDADTLDQVDGDRTATALPRPPNSNVGRVTLTSTTFQTRINEINLVSTDEGPARWVVGLFSLNEDIPFSILRDNNHTVNYVSATSDISGAVHNDSKSVFGQVSYFLTEKVEAVGGARYSWDKQVFRRIALPGVILTPANNSDTATSEAVTGKIGLNYHPDDDTMIYVSASRGYKAGGANLLPGQADFSPEINYVYESGVKLTRFDRRLRVNASVFYSDYEDIQFSANINGLAIQQNAAKGKSYGGELEVTGQFDALGVSFGAGYLHSEFGASACLANSFNNPGSPLCTPGNDFVAKGTVLPFAPKWTLNAAIDYEIALGGTMSLTPRLQWAHVSDQYITPFLQPFTRVGAHDIVDARLTLAFGDDRLIEAFATNLLDETYVAAQVVDGSSSTGGTAYGAPRQVGFRALYRF